MAMIQVRYIWVQLAEFALRVGDHVAAKKYLVEALRHCKAFDDADTEWELSLVQAWLSFLEGDCRGGVQVLLRAQAGQRATDGLLWQRTITAIVTFLQDAGRVEDAKTVIAQATAGALRVLWWTWRLVVSG